MLMPVLNKTFLEISGFTEEEVLGWTSKEALAVIHPNDVLGFKVKMAKALLGKFKNAFTYDG